MTSLPQPAEAQLCANAENLHADLLWQTAQLQQFLGSLLGALAILYFLLDANRMPQIFEGVGKILVQWMMAFILVHNLCILSITVWHRILRIRQGSSSCDLLVVTWTCLLLRVPSTACISGMTGVCLLLTVDAFCQAYVPAQRVYERVVAGSKPAWRIFVCLALFTVISTVYVFYDEEMSLHRMHCSATSSRVNRRFRNLYILLLAVDVTCTISFCALSRHFFHALKRNKHEFVVERKVQMRTKIAAMRFHVASTFLRCVFVWPFLFGSAVVRIFVSFADVMKFFELLATLYIIQWYGSAFAFILFCWRPFRISHSAVSRISPGDQRNIHFENLQKQWNGT